MSIVILGGYRNQNSNRNHPFTDGCTMRTLSGQLIAPDLFVDAQLWPIDSADEIYVHSWNPGAGMLYLAEVGSTLPFAGAAITRTSETADVYELTPAAESDAVGTVTSLSRQIGVLVFGPSAPLYFSGSEMTFDSTGLVFAANTCTRLNQSGVRGLLVGNTLVAGDVVITGEQGAVLNSYIENGVQILEISFIGQQTQSSEITCFTDPRTGDPVTPIRTIEVVQEDESIFVLDLAHDNQLDISGNNIDLALVCAARNQDTVSNAEDACAGGGSNVVVVPAPEALGEQTLTLTPSRGGVWFNTPTHAGTPRAPNIFGIKNMKSLDVPLINLPPILPVSPTYYDANPPLERPFSRQGVMLYMKGLSKFQ